MLYYKMVVQWWLWKIQPLTLNLGIHPIHWRMTWHKTMELILGNNVVIDVYGYQAFQNPYFAIGYQYATHVITQKMSTHGHRFPIRQECIYE